MYTTKNFKTKKALKEAVQAGDDVRVLPTVAGIGNSGVTEGTVYLEGPHYPEPHKWYAQATLKDGKVVSVK